MKYQQEHITDMNIHTKRKVKGNTLVCFLNFFCHLKIHELLSDQFLFTIRYNYTCTRSLISVLGSLGAVNNHINNNTDRCVRNHKM